MAHERYGYFYLIELAPGVSANTGYLLPSELLFLARRVACLELRRGRFN